MYQLYTCYCNKHEYPHLVTVLGNFGGTAGTVPPSSELKHYLDESVTITNPLEWWQPHEPKFPRVAKLASKVFGSNSYFRAI